MPLGRPAHGVETLVPAAGWLRSYDPGWLRADVLAGTTAAAVVIPQAMGYATVLLPYAIVIAVMSYFETVTAARISRRPDDPPLDNNHECTSAGVATLAGAFFQTVPPAGGFSTASRPRSTPGSPRATRLHASYFSMRPASATFRSR